MRAQKETSIEGDADEEDASGKGLARRTCILREKQEMMFLQQPPESTMITDSLTPDGNFDSLQEIDDVILEGFFNGRSDRPTSPGVVHVPGFADSREGLPIARRVPRNRNEFIIDGHPVSPSSAMKKDWIFDRKIICFLALYSTIFTLLLGLIMYPTLRKTQLYQVLVPISGEKALNDKSTIQHSIFMYMAENMDRLNHFTELKKKREEIIEHYAYSVGFFSVLGAYECNVPEISQDLCDAFLFNEDRQVSVMVLRNLQLTQWGGGTLASEVGELIELTDLVFARDHIISTIPTEIGKLKHLRNLDLRSNHISGTIPTEIGLLENLEWIYLDENKLTGTIPTEIGNLKNLIFANFSHNSLSGTLPSEVSNLVDLGGIALQHNTISGSLQPFCNLNFTNDPFLIEKNLDPIQLNYVFNYSGLLGLYSDCQDGVPIVDCDCCICD